MLITQLKSKETITSLVNGKKFFIINCQGCKEVHFPEKEAAELLRFVKVYMEKYNLVLNEEKTILTTTENGVDFLGYRFSETGKSVPVKAEMNLQEKLEQIFLLSRDLPIKEKLKKGAEVLEGWEQYYREERQIHSIWEYVVVLYMVQNKERQKNLSPSQPSADG